ncbi:MAG: DUF4266 domain-containing protein [Methylococcales bacterium]|nr:DUF4266 domain-containing protein [Methylococcales bacterium]
MKIMLLLCLIALFGCTQVKPWQRDRLAAPQMAFDTDPLETELRQHSAFSKEASSGGYGGGGGGCGCN